MSNPMPMPGVLADREIRELAQTQQMIVPFVEAQQRDGVVSFGLTSYGYDIRVSNHYKIFTNVFASVVDPKNFGDTNVVDFTGEVCIIPPNSFVLAETIERFKIPRDILGICIGKSTYARCGLIVNVTPLEPEWEGILTLEISNTTPLPAKVYSNEGIAQMLFFRGASVCEVSYADRKGKYQHQTGLTLPKL